MKNSTVKNAMSTYANHKKELDRIKNCSYKNEDYYYYKGCCETAEMWMKAIGISQCNSESLFKYETYEDLINGEKEYMEGIG